MGYFTPGSVMDSPSIDQLLLSIPQDPLLQSFSKYYLLAHSATSLWSLPPAELTQFLQDRLANVLPLNPGESRVAVSDITPSHTTLPKVMIDCVCPDAVFLVMTLTELIRSMGYKVTQLVHPIVGATRTKTDQIDGFVSPLHAQERLSLTTITIDGVPLHQIESLLVPRIHTHLGAIHLSYNDQTNIRDGLGEVKVAIENAMPALSEPKEEWANLLDWLYDDNFSFFGMICFHHNHGNVSPIDSSEMGIFKSGGGYDATPLHAAALRQSQWLAGFGDDFVFDTLSVVSPILRFDSLMRLSFRLGRGQDIIEYVFVGLLKRSSLLAKNLDTPLIHRKMKAIFESKGMIPNSFDYNEVIRIFTAIPKFELFRSSQFHLQFIVESLLSITNPSELVVVERRLQNGRHFVMVVIPDALTSRHNIERVQRRVMEWFSVDDDGYECIEVTSPEHTRLHVYLPGEWVDEQKAPLAVLQTQLRDAIQPWESRLQLALEERVPDFAASWLMRYQHAFPEHHQVRRTVESTVQDIRLLEDMRKSGDIQFQLTDFESPGSMMDGNVSNLSIYNPTKIDLIAIMPILENAGLYVYDELTTRVGELDAPIGYIHSFRVADSLHGRITDPMASSRLIELLKAVFLNRAENDSLNRLGLLAGLTARETHLVQVYRNLLLQLKCGFTRDKLNRALLANPEAVAAWVTCFHARLSPDDTVPNSVLAEEVFQAALTKIKDSGDDLILRRYKNLLDVTLRTNFYLPVTNDRTHISIKLDSQRIQDIPLPAPYREIYVHDVGMEGVHLRFGPIARGGLRWSDRPDDFRTEVLSLVKTQQTKNVVIVPVGSKGGFILKRTGLGREELAQEGVAQYRRFISGLLDITDNLLPDGQIQTPHRVVRHDDYDPYLVVAADKGTASFSDIANEVAADYQFWLGDAFASGGSQGYSHKKEGITARGAWECVKLHFSELGKSIQTEKFTVAGIGDMSGDVFGNGMLLSPVIQLQAAFNHVHIFIDPNPDVVASYQERKRLFELPRSAWTDYNLGVISAGGGVFERSAKSIEVTPQMKALLDIEASVVTGEELIRAILGMRVELMWLGGIGTYYCSTSQVGMNVGDPSNDSVRLPISSCRAQVVGEGANLGVTQPARIEFAAMGGRINTDAIDNSAGVNFSDYEVNIKILLTQLIADGHLAATERNRVLEEATNEVARLVLANNRGQHRLLTLDSIRSTQRFSIFQKLIEHLVKTGMMDAKTEQIPVGDVLLEFGESIPRPILAVVQAYIKMHVYDGVMASSLPDDPYFQTMYERYFPDSIQSLSPTPMPRHRLQRNIVATLLTNRIVNQAGVLFFYETQLITGASVATIANAYWVIDQVLGLASLRSELAHTGLSESVICEMVVAIEQQVMDLVQAVLMIPNWPVTLSMIPDLQAWMPSLKSQFGSVSAGEDWVSKGVSVGMAQQVNELMGLSLLPESIGLGGDRAGEWVLAVATQFGLTRMKELIRNMQPRTEWELTHQGILLRSLYRAIMQVADRLRQSNPTGAPQQVVLDWINGNEAGREWLVLMSECLGASAPSFSMMAVGMARLSAVTGDG